MTDEEIAALKQRALLRSVELIREAEEAGERNVARYRKEHSFEVSLREFEYIEARHDRGTYDGKLYMGMQLVLLTPP